MGQREQDVGQLAACAAGSSDRRTMTPAFRHASTISMCSNESVAITATRLSWSEASVQKRVGQTRVTRSLVSANDRDSRPSALSVVGPHEARRRRPLPRSDRDPVADRQAGQWLAQPTSSTRPRASTPPSNRSAEYATPALSVGGRVPDRVGDIGCRVLLGEQSKYLLVVLAVDRAGAAYLTGRARRARSAVLRRGRDRGEGA